VNSSVADDGDRIVVEFPATGYRSVGRLVLGGLAARFELPVDRVEELLLALESLLFDDVAGSTVTLEAAAAPDGLRVRVGPFSGPRLADPAVARVLGRLVDEAADGGHTDAGTWVELAVSASWLHARG
jgi:hypothetical protein